MPKIRADKIKGFTVLDLANTALRLLYILILPTLGNTHTADFTVFIMNMLI